MFHGSYAFSLHDANIHKTFSSQPLPVFSLSYTILVNGLFTDGCFSLSTPSGMNDLDIGTSRTIMTTALPKLGCDPTGLWEKLEVDSDGGFTVDADRPLIWSRLETSSDHRPSRSHDRLCSSAPP